MTSEQAEAALSASTEDQRFWAVDAVGVTTQEEMPGGRLTITGHTDHGVPTGDWQFDIKRQRFTVDAAPKTEAAVAALRDVPPEVLRKVLGRLIDQTTIGFVVSEGSTGMDISDATMIGASVLKGVLNAEERTKFTAALLCPGAMDGDIVQITALRLTKPAEPEEERPEV